MAVDMSYYGTVEDADTYFAALLRRDLWFDATPQEKQQALVAATKQIDRLNFKWEKVESDQVLQFPRTADPDVVVTEVPEAIEAATYELAYTLMNDVDPDAEFRNEKRQSHTFNSIKTTIDSSFVQEHIHAGIPSSSAWNLLLPYLEPVMEFTMQRVS